jgi:hypothetical protein
VLTPLARGRRLILLDQLPPHKLLTHDVLALPDENVGNEGIVLEQVKGSPALGIERYDLAVDNSLPAWMRAPLQWRDIGHEILVIV